MLARRYSTLFVALLVLCAAVSPQAKAQDDHSRGRKYKAPPETSHIEVEVVRNSNGKPVVNAAVVFNSEKDGKSEGNLEVKTGPDGKATIDVIPTGSTVRVQVIADGFATFAEEYEVKESERHIDVKLLRPRAQVSAYQENTGKASDRKPGVQEPNRPAPTKPATPPPPPPSPPSSAGTPPSGSSTTPPAKPNL
jgi:hypothetical protein